MDRSADSPRLFGEKARARLSPVQPDLLQEAPKFAFPVLSSVTGAVQALSQQPTLPRAQTSSVSFGKLKTEHLVARTIFSVLSCRARLSTVDHAHTCMAQAQVQMDV